MGGSKGLEGESREEDEPISVAGDSSWQTTEQLLQTLNKELGGLKEYVLTELRGEITALRSEKVQLQSQVQELRHQREALLNEVQANDAQLESAPLANNHRLTDATLDSIELPDGKRSNLAWASDMPAGAVSPGIQADVSSMEMPDLAWREPGLADESAVNRATGGMPEVEMPSGEKTSASQVGEAEASIEPRSMGHPTDVASVLSAMPDLRPPANTGPSKTGPNSQAAAMPRPPRLTTPIPANASSASEAAEEPETLAEDDDGGDEAFIDDFPINVVRPDVSAFPAARDADAQARSQGAAFVDLASVNRVSGSRASVNRPAREFGASRIVMPPGMVDRGGEATAAAAPPPPTQPVSPWLGEPPTTISSLIELTDRGAGALFSGAGRDGKTGVTEPGVSLGQAPMGAEVRAASGAIASPSMEFQGLPGLSGQPGTAASSDSLLLEAEMGDRRSRVPLQRKGAAIAIVSLLLGALQYATVQVLFHGAPWIADGQGFIAATWSDALVTFWIRMLMLLPFMIVIGQGLYPSLLPEAQAVFRDRDPIPLVSIGLSGLFFFLAHFLLYGTIAMNSATPAVALFFLYPVLGQGLGWGLFNQRLSLARLLAMVPLVLGIILILLQWSGPGGRTAGLASALSYALFLMLTAVNGRRMHPLTLTVLQFGLAWLWAVPAVFFLPQAMPLNHLGYVMACALLSATVGLGQLFGLASRRHGTGLSAMLQGVIPLVVGVVCWGLTDEVLSIGQMFAVLLVSGGAIALGFQRLSRDGT